MWANGPSRRHALTVTRMTPVRSLARKLALIGSAVLALALGSIGLTLWVSWQLEGGAAAVNEAGRLRMLTWQLAATAPVGDGGDARAAQIARLQAGLALLRDGDPARPLVVPWNDEARFFKSVYSPSTGAMRLSIAQRSLFLRSTTSTGILLCHRPMSVKGALRSVIS